MHRWFNVQITSHNEEPPWRTLHERVAVNFVSVSNVSFRCDDIKIKHFCRVHPQKLMSDARKAEEEARLSN